MTTCVRYLSFLLISLNISCSSGINSQDDCDELKTVSVDMLQRNGFTNFQLQNIEMPKMNKSVNLVINSRADYEKYVVPADSLPEIDFNSNTVIGGVKYLPTCGAFGTQVVNQGCGKIFYSVNLERQDCSAKTHVFYFAIIPKTESEIMFNIN